MGEMENVEEYRQRTVYRSDTYGMASCAGKCFCVSCGYYRYTYGFLYGYICSSGHRVDSSTEVS